MARTVMLNLFQHPNNSGYTTERILIIVWDAETSSA